MFPSEKTELAHKVHPPETNVSLDVSQTPADPVTITSGTPGKNARKWMSSRFIVGFSVPIVVWLGVYLFAKDMYTAASYGIPLALLVTGAFFLSSDYQRLYRITQDRISTNSGVSAEEMVAKFLNNLPVNCFVIHGLSTCHGDIDHILICPKGVFSIETKSYTGSVSVSGDKLLRNNRPFKPDPVVQALLGARTIRETLASEFPDVPVEPILLFPNGRVRIKKKVKGVTVASLSFFSQYLDQRSDFLSAKAAMKVYYALLNKWKKSK